MSNDKIKTYKNPHRNEAAEYKPYVPQYQVWGVEPGEYKSSIVPENTPVVQKPQESNPRAPRPSLRQPYAAAIPSPVGRGRGPIPNVGNNVEHTWSGVDGEIIDDLSGNVDPNHPMIDNNDYVSPAALGLPTTREELPALDEVKEPTRTRFTREEVDQAFDRGFHQEVNASLSSEEDLFLIVRDLAEGSYLLIVGGVPLCSGPKEDIEDQAKALVFGEHEMCDGNPIPDDDIVIIKRVPIKIGLFLE